MQYNFCPTPKYMMITIVPNDGEMLGIDSLKSGIRQYFEHSHCQTGQRVIWDARNLEGIDLTLEELYEFGIFLTQYREQRGQGKSAFVVKDALMFGLARMHQMLNEQKIDTRFEVFRDFDAAELWLDRPDD